MFEIDFREIEGTDLILSAGAISFLTILSERFEKSRQELLSLRVERQDSFNAGNVPGFLDNTREVRKSDWKVCSTPDEILNRTVEITGPVDRKMIINALNSGADVFMADFEDSLSPTWSNVINGQINLRDAVRKVIHYETEKKSYSLNDEIATLFVRPRGLHLNESNFVTKSGEMSASLFDFGLYMYHNGRELLSRGTRPYFYIPKLEHHLEARWWNNVFEWTQRKLGISTGMIRATVLIETLPAAFQMNEILYELRNHSAGLNCGRWDYIFSYIKTLRNHSDRVLGGRSGVTMTVPFMNTYSNLLVDTCKRRGAQAIGGMAAQVPIRNDSEANISAMNKVRGDKIRESMTGYDGTWVAHPGLVKVARDAFSEYANSTHNNTVKESTGAETGSSIDISDMLLAPHFTTVLEDDVINNIAVCIHYLAAWLAGNGCVQLNNLMEDAATAEISRAQIWQWKKHGIIKTDDEFEDMFSKAVNNVKNEVNDFNNHYKLSTSIVRNFCNKDILEEFLTSYAYNYLD